MKRGAWIVAASVAAFEAAAQSLPDTAGPARTRFDTRLLRGAGQVDLSRFERGDAIAPGLHSLDVVRNGEPLGRRRVRFSTTTACLDTPLAESIGLALHALPAAQRSALEDATQCVALESLVPAARAEYVAEALALHVTVPQAALVHRARDAIDPALRDAGIPAFRINYAFNGLHDDHGRGDATRASARIELGANAAGWRWRHRATHAWADGGSLRSNTLSSTLEHDLDAVDAQLTLGDFHTSGVVFDTIGLRGVRLASDDRMLPPSMSRYAPVIHGVANTNARVQVRQGGALLHDTTVPPGPFALRDVQPLGIGNALDVQVTEADGHVTTFSVPHAAVPGLLRAGHARFSLAAGQWRPAHATVGTSATDLVFQGTVQRGVRDRLTVHAGAQLAPGYLQALVGVAVSTRAGAIALDRAQSQWAPSAGPLRGQVWRVAYAGHVPATGTQVDIATWRHASGGFLSLGEAMRGATADALREHTRTDASLRHAMGHRGSALTLGLVDRAWRGPRARQRSLRVGWGIPLRAAGLLQATFEQGLSGARQATTATLSLSVPLTFGASPALLHAHARSVDAHTTLHASGSGAFGPDRRHAWGGGVTHALQSTGDSTTASAALSTQGRLGRAGTGLSASQHTRQWSATAEGSLLLHAHGATFGMPLGDTVALVRAPHGAGVALVQQPAVRLDAAGHGVVPHLSSYRRNTIGVDPAWASKDVQFDWTERTVVPRAGAVVDVFLPTTRAPLQRLRIVQANREPVAFAAEIRDTRETPLGTVGRDGIAVLRVPADSPALELHWREDGQARRCRIALPPRAARAAIPPDTPCTE